MPMEMSTAKFVELKEQIQSKFLSPVGDIFIYICISKGPIDSLNIYPRYDSLWVAKFWFQKHPRGWASFEP